MVLAQTGQLPVQVDLNWLLFRELASLLKLSRKCAFLEID
jgi:hypothetical protein